MYEDILVTVITCVYNTPEEYLKEAVKSILGQTHRNFEYIIVDDCSDKDLYVDDIFKDERIKLIRLEKNGGAAIARNAALKIAQGKYIAIMDSDDISYHNRFEKQIAFMEENKDVAVCGTWFRQIGEKSNTVKRIIDDNEYYRCCLLFKNIPTILNPSAMIRKQVLDDNNLMYDERLRKGQDYGMWVKISQYGKCTNLKEVLIDYRWHKQQITQRLYTYDIDQYDWIVIKGQLDALNVSLTNQEERLLHKNYRSVEVPAYEYWKLLQKILAANKESHFFVQEKLEQRVREQWRSKIYNTNSVGKLIELIIKIPVHERKELVIMQLERIKDKVLKKGIDT